MPSISVHLYTLINNRVNYIADCIVRNEDEKNRCVVATESDHFEVDNPRATLREVVNAVYSAKHILLSRNSEPAQELLDVAIADFPEEPHNNTEYYIKVLQQPIAAATEKTDNTMVHTGTIVISLASNYRGFIEDFTICKKEDRVVVETGSSTFIFKDPLTTLREIAKTCWSESKPLLFRNRMPAPVLEQESLDIPIQKLIEMQEDYFTLEIHEKGNILYSD